MLRVVLALAVLGSAAVARAESVVVFPLDPRGVSYGTANDATRIVLETVRGIAGVKVIEPAAVEAEIGVNLTEQARSCDYDIFCLVEVGEVLQGDRMLIGHVRLVTSRGAPELHELKVIVLDVAKATIGEVLIWRIPTAQENGLADAARAATKRLFAPADAHLVLELEPPDARVYFYGELVPRPKDGLPLPYWSGTYLALVEAEGFQKQELRVEIPASGGRTRIPIQLQPDLLYVKKKGDPKADPFGQTSRREGSGVTSDVAGAVTETDGPELIALTPWPWIVAAGGAALVVGGGVLMGQAQGAYNELSGQERYSPGVTVTSAVAVERRDQARGRYRIGSGLALSGVGVILAAAIWVIVDYALYEPPDPAAPVAGKVAGALGLSFAEIER